MRVQVLVETPLLDAYAGSEDWRASMPTIVTLALIGFVAQLVDGALGMGYGVTSTSLLLLLGTSAAAASAMVHLAEVGTTMASGLSHWRFNNVDWRVVLQIGIPGAVGAFTGATLLSLLSTDAAAPFVSAVLLLLGMYILVRFALPGTKQRPSDHRLRRRFLIPLGLVAGFIDATGGGGWGPVGTPALLASGRMDPRKVVGSVDTSEFLVAVAASVGFLLGVGAEDISWTLVLGLLMGGVVAAPAAAYLVRLAPTRILGSAVGTLILLTNSRTLLRSEYVGAPDVTRWATYSLILTAGSITLVLAHRAHQRAVLTARLEGDMAGFRAGGG